MSQGSAGTDSWAASQLLVAFLAVFLLASAHAAPRISLSIDDIRSPILSARGIRAALTGTRAAQLEITLDEIAAQGRVWRNLRFSCPTFRLGERIDCEGGTLHLSNSAAIPAEFSYSSREKTLDARIRTVSGGAGEDWRLAARWAGSAWEGTLTVANGQAARIAGLLPDREKANLAFVKGAIDGTIRIRGTAAGPESMEIGLAVAGLAFGDASGLHAGEGIDARLDATAERQGGAWMWRAGTAWPRGEVFWQPLYLTGRGHRLDAGGRLEGDVLHLLEGRLALAGVGEVRLAGEADWANGVLRDLDLHTEDLDLASLFEHILKPFLAGSSFAGLGVSGRAGAGLRLRDGAPQRLVLDLRGAAVEDEHGRFAFHGVDARIPWQAQGVSSADIRVGGGRLEGVPLGAFRVPLQIGGDEVFIPHMMVPVLDGEFILKNFHASHEADEDWHWQFSGRLSPVSMQKLTEALGSRPMYGTLSGTIPRVSYADRVLGMDGSLLFRVFDGTVEVRGVTVRDPFGRAPALEADLDMHELDLGMLTSVFSFGSMQGRVDVAVHGLELFDWKPVRFDARVASSPGSYPRRISQAAVQNISALGGSGAAAAIQRSFLHVFEEFGYSRIGWSCSLRNGVCEMGGIASEHSDQGYVIVKGGGIPAITVIGYNRSVDWWELLDRLQRVTQENVQPIFK